MEVVILITTAVVLVGLFIANVIAKDGDSIYEIGNEQDEEARKKLLEQQDKDIDLDFED